MKSLPHFYKSHKFPWHTAGSKYNWEFDYDENNVQQNTENGKRGGSILIDWDAAAILPDEETVPSFLKTSKHFNEMLVTCTSPFRSPHAAWGRQ
jgi:hypothetical protein